MSLLGLPVWCTPLLWDSECIHRGPGIWVVFSVVQLGLPFWTLVSHKLALSFASGEHLATITISLGKQRALTCDLICNLEQQERAVGVLVILGAPPLWVNTSELHYWTCPTSKISLYLQCENPIFSLSEMIYLETWTVSDDVNYVFPFVQSTLANNLEVMKMPKDNVSRR